MNRWDVHDEGQGFFVDVWNDLSDSEFHAVLAVYAQKDRNNSHGAGG